MCPISVAGDFLTCCGEERGPMGESAVCAALEKGVETGGVAAASWEGVRPCWEAPAFMGVGVDIVAVAILSRAVFQ
jgi:hypothetical protein